MGASKHKMFSQDNNRWNGAVVDDSGATSYTNEYNTKVILLVAVRFATKIFISGRFRRECNSRFATENQWVTSVGRAAWLVDREDWLMPKDFDLKFKAALVRKVTTNFQLPLTDRYDISNSGGDVAVTFSGKCNPDITWETNTYFNAGIDYEAFDGRVSGSIDYFHRTTSDMLFAFSTPSSLGYSSIWRNVGDMVNEGVELDLHATLVRTKNFQWDVNFNLTKVKNRVTLLDAENKTTEGTTFDGETYNGYISGSKFVGEGLPLYTWYLKKYAGVNENGESTWYYEKTDDEGVVTRETTTDYSTADYYVQGSAIPDWYGGFGTTLLMLSDSISRLISVIKSVVWYSIAVTKSQWVRPIRVQPATICTSTF